MLTVDIQPVAYRPVYPLSRLEKICVVRDILSAAVFLHGISYVHRDIREANIMQRKLDELDDEPTFMLVDFEQVGVHFTKEYS